MCPMCFCPPIARDWCRGAILRYEPIYNLLRAYIFKLHIIYMMYMYTYEMYTRINAYGQPYFHLTPTALGDARYSARRFGRNVLTLFASNGQTKVDTSYRNRNF